MRIFGFRERARIASGPLAVHIAVDHDTDVLIFDFMPLILGERHRVREHSRMLSLQHPCLGEHYSGHADRADDLAFRVCFSDLVQQLRVAPQVLRRPFAPGDDQRIDGVDVDAARWRCPGRPLRRASRGPSACLFDGDVDERARHPKRRPPGRTAPRPGSLPALRPAVPWCFPGLWP